MTSRKTALLTTAAFLWMGVHPPAAHADNQMGYKLVSQRDVANLPRTHVTLGMDVERAQQITSQDLVFDTIRVKQVHRGSPGEEAGLVAGDQIIAVDGRVFASLVAFAGYVGSLPPGSQATVDYMPAQGGPSQAQRVMVTLAALGQTSQDTARTPGMSTSTKVAIGVGAAALFGCYEMGCFSRGKVNQQAPSSSAIPRTQPYRSPAQNPAPP
jgi:hypothetical protein